MTSNTNTNPAVESNQNQTEDCEKKFKWKASYTELLFIIGGVALVFLAWSYYPEYISWRDNSQSKETTQMVIPYQIDAMLKTEAEPSESIEEEKTKFQKVGEVYGTYGDSYGSLNTLFSGLAFAFLVASLFLQRKELQAQRSELEEQRKEIKKSNEIADRQEKITDQQRELIEQQVRDAQTKNFYDQLFRFLERYEEKVDRPTKVSRGTGPHNYCEEFNSQMINSINSGFKKSDNWKKFNHDHINVDLNNFLNYTNKKTYYKFEEIRFYETAVFIINFINKHEHLNIISDSLKIFDYYLDKHSKLTILLGAFKNNEIKLLAHQNPDFFKDCLPEDPQLAKLVMKLASDTHYSC